MATYSFQRTPAPKPLPLPKTINVPGPSGPIAPPSTNYQGANYVNPNYLAGQGNAGTAPLYQGTDVYNAPVFDPSSGSTDPTGYAPIYAPGYGAPPLGGLSPGDWVAPYDPNSGAPNPYTDPGSSTSPSYDPSYAAAQAAQLEAQAALHSSLRSARGRALIDFGDPTLAGTAGMDVDPITGQLAQQNYASGNAVLARLAKAHDDRRNALIGSLAGRGILQSGELGYQTGQEAQTYGSQTYDAWKQLMDYMGNLTQQDVGQSRTSRDTLINALQGAFTNRLNQGF